jgi:hypothetical protein
MTASAIDPSDPHARPAACENCGSVLQGHYCHVCGQRAHNPLRSFAHAVEEVFESLWHLDGRIFRTTRELFVPGRVAVNYLAGHRVRYIAPLRLFVILSLITFFVGKLTLHISPESVDAPAGTTSGLRIDTGTEDQADEIYRQAADIEAVLAIRKAELLELEEAARNPIVGLTLPLVEDIVEKQLDTGARRRMIALGMAADRADTALAQQDAALGRNAVAAGAAADRGLIERWMSRRGERMKENMLRIREDPDEFVRLFLGALPGALFLLVPLFALLLKLVYIRSGRGYLEHLVVALYSHAFMLAALLTVFLLVGLQSWLGGVGANLASVSASLVMSVLIPLYLLLMQKRAYGQGWFKTLLKYVMLGLSYGLLLVLGILYALVAGLSS